MREEIVREYFSKGKLLTPEALELLLIGKGVETTGMIASAARRTACNVTRNITVKKKEASVDDFARFYRSKYEKLRDILVERIQRKFISLNKLDFYRNEVFVIGMIRDMREKDDKIIVDLEDMTACLPIVFEKGAVAGAALDDVVAVKAISAKNVLFGKQIIFPDVPLRAPSTGAGRICVVSDLDLHEAPRHDVERFFSWASMQNFQFLTVAGNIGDTRYFEECVGRYCQNKTVITMPGEKDTAEEYPYTPMKFTSENIISISNPAMIEIGGLNIVMTRNFETASLKKRYIGKTSAVMDGDMLVLDTVPDIVCSGSRWPQITNYKSVTIASSGGLLTEFRPVVIDMATRDAVHMQV